MIILNVISYLSLLVALTSFYSIYFENPHQDQTFLVESLKYVQELPFPEHMKELNNHKYDFKLIKVLDYEARTPKEYLERPIQKPIIVFLTIGSNGHIFSIPATMNSLFNHTMLLNNIQTKIHYQLVAYAFDFHQMSSAFSKGIIEQEAKFVQQSVQFIMRDIYPNESFHLIGHSMGGVVNYLASTQEGFLTNQLKTIVCISSPISGAPQYVNDEVLKVFDQITTNPQFNYVKENVLNVIIHGGTRDNLVRSEISFYNNKFDFKYVVSLFTEEMKNLFKAIDHNSSYYYKYFLDAMVPPILKILTSDESVEARMLLSKQKLLFQDEELLVENVGSESQALLPEYSQKLKHKQALIHSGNQNQMLYIERDTKHQDIIIFGNIDRVSDLQLQIRVVIEGRIFLRSIDFKDQRIYYPANFFMVKLTNLSESSQLFMEIKGKNYEHQLLEDLQNFSPSFDKRTPTKIPIKREPIQYVGVAYKEEQALSKIFQTDLLTSLFGMTFHLDLVDRIEIVQDTLSRRLISTVVPLEICLQSPSQIAITIQIKDYYSNNNFYFLNDQNSCIKTHPKRIGYQNMPLQITIYRYQDQLKDQSIIIAPNYMQLLRECTISNMWIIIYLGFLLNFIRAQYKSVLLTYVLPFIVLFSHLIDLEIQYFEYFYVSQKLDLSILDIVLIFIMAQTTVILVDLIYFTLKVVGKLISKLFCCIPVKAMIVVVKLTIIPLLMTQSILVLAVPIILLFAVTKVERDFFNYHVIAYVLQLDKLLIDVWRFIQYRNPKFWFSNDFFPYTNIGITISYALVIASIHWNKIQLPKQALAFWKAFSIAFYAIKLLSLSEYVYLLHPRYFLF